MKKYATVVLLIFSILISIYTRVIGVTYDFTSLVETDSVRYVHQAQQILEQGRMPDVEPLRAAPIGEKTSIQLTLYPYVIATIYQLVKQLHIDFETFVIILPVLLFVLTIIPIYLLVSRIFGHDVALLAINILVLTPPLLARSYAGFADRDGFVLLLAMWSFFFYVHSLLETGYKQWIYRALSSCAMLCLGLTWQGVGIFASIVVTVELIKLMVGESYNWKSANLFALWTFPIVTGLSLFKPDVYSHISQPYAFMVIIYPACVLLISLLVLATKHFPLLKKFFSLNNRLPAGFGMVLLLGIVSFLPISDRIFNALIPSLIKPYGDDPLFQVIAELQKLGAIGWAFWPGAFFVAMMIGLFLITNDICDALNLHKYWTLGLIQLIIFGIAFSRLASGQSDANFIETPFTLGIYFISMGIGIIGLLVGFVHARLRRDVKTPSSIESMAWIKLFLAIWCIGMLVSMRAAVRFAYLFTIPSTILGSYTLLWPFKRWIPQGKRIGYTPYTLFVSHGRCMRSL